MEFILISTSVLAFCCSRKCRVVLIYGEFGSILKTCHFAFSYRDFETHTKWGHLGTRKLVDTISSYRLSCFVGMPLLTINTFQCKWSLR